MNENDAEKLLEARNMESSQKYGKAGERVTIIANAGASYVDPEKDLSVSDFRKKLEAFSLLRASGKMGINSTDAYGETALSKAIRLNDSKVVGELLALGADPNCMVAQEPGIVRAVERRNLEMLKMLVEHGAEVYDEGDAYRTTAFCQACMMPDNREIMVYLIEKGACLNCPAFDSQPPIMVATLDNKRILLEFGADINAYDVAHGGNALDAALLEYCNVLESGDKTMATIHFLLEKGIDVNSRKGIQWTCLMTAVRTGDPKLVRLILDYGGKPQLKDQEGKTAFDQIPANCKYAGEIRRMLTEAVRKQD